jgi:multidrug efflux pump subunit AcrA (membrane-fusion protein)
MPAIVGPASATGPDRISPPRLAGSAQSIWEVVVGVTRRTVFPAVRILLLAVIAAALVELAFGGDPATDDEDPLSPTADVVEPQVAITTGTIVNDVDIDAVIAANPPVVVKATDEGTVSVLLAEPGQVVEAGDPLLEVVSEEAGEPHTETAEDGTVSEVPGETTRRYHAIESPVAGTVGEFSVLRGQAVSIGDQVGTVEAGGFAVSATITPEQQYRLLGAPASAHVAPQGGQAPFECANVRVGRAEGSTTDPAQGPADPMSGPQSNTRITCDVPAGTTVFDGASATLTVSAGQADGVLVAPVTAVEGSFESGNVWVVTGGAEPEKRAVTLGLTDGELVEIRDGVVEGETILEFVPGRDEMPGGAAPEDMAMGAAG